MVIIVMGVSGCGKSTVGRLLAARLRWPFYEGDDFHPPANVEKMRRGIELDDADRRPWLEALHALVGDILRQGRDAVVTCSALKERYRRIVQGELTEVAWVWLTGAPQLLAARVARRRHAFMPASLLPAQLSELEPPHDALALDYEATPESLVESIIARLVLPPASASEE